MSKKLSTQEIYNKALVQSQASDELKEIFDIGIQMAIKGESDRDIVDNSNKFAKALQALFSTQKNYRKKTNSQKTKSKNSTKPVCSLKSGFTESKVQVRGGSGIKDTGRLFVATYNQDRLAMVN